MKGNKMTLAEELEWRGFFNQTTFKNSTDINQPRTFYWGVDPSADSMTIGNLAPAMMIRHLIEHGHKAILLVGGATGMIGDPDGKKQERDLRTIEEIAHNKASIAAQYSNIFDGLEFEVVDNYDWFKSINFLDFLRDIGKHAPLTQMLDRDFVQSRIGEGGDGISYAEFSYSLIQGYDFLHLHRTKGVTLQVAGADQWGNSISGVQMIRRIEGAESHVWTAPLVVNRATGVKFGKSEGGAVWLDEHKTSPYSFYQFWLNVDDETAKELVKIYTLLDITTIENLLAQHDKEPQARVLQKTLASEVTTLIHGKQRCASVKAVVDVLFSDRPVSELQADELDELAREVPVVGPSPIQQVLLEAGLVKSNGEARRAIEAGSVKVNGVKVDSLHNVDAPSLVKKGKNGFALVR